MSRRDDAAGFVATLVAEPALVRGVITSVVTLLGALGLVVADKDTAAVTALVLAVLPLVQAVLTRAKVTPVRED